MPVGGLARLGNPGKAGGVEFVGVFGAAAFFGAAGDPTAFGDTLAVIRLGNAGTVEFAGFDGALGVPLKFPIIYRC